MKRVISLVMVFTIIMSMSVLSFADISKSADKYGNVVVVDNNNFRIVKSPTKDGDIFIKYFKKTGKFETIGVDGKIMSNSEKSGLEDNDFSLKSTAYPSGTYQKTFYNYEYFSHDVMSPWELRRPQDKLGVLNYYYFYSWENGESRQYLDEFADDVEELDDAEKNFLLSGGYASLDLIIEFALAAPYGQYAGIAAVLMAVGENSVDVIDAAYVIGDAASECADSYFYVLDNFRWR